MLLDFTGHYPLITDECRSSLWVRMRKVPDETGSNWPSGGDTTFWIGPTRPSNVYVLTPTRRFGQIFGQVIEDYQIKATTTTSYRFVSAVPHKTQPWVMVPYTLVFRFNSSRIELDVGTQKLFLLVNSYDYSSNDAPREPSQIPMSHRPTYWERLE